jgi:hypothetical protein
MGLRQCPDCGHDVSSGAVACPHCGRPNRQAATPVELSGILIIAALCAGVLVWRLSLRYEAPRESAAAIPPETVIASPSRDPEGLRALVGYNRRLSLLRVENLDAFAWSHCQLSLNARGVSSGYTHDVESIRPGITEAALIESAEFLGDSGRRFDPATEPVASLEIACDTPQGTQSYAGRFEPPKSAGGGG